MAFEPILRSMRLPSASTCAYCMIVSTESTRHQSLRAKMPLIHHIATDHGRPSIVLVRGFACACSDWDAQMSISPCTTRPSRSVWAGTGQALARRPSTRSSVTALMWPKSYERSRCLPLYWHATAWGVGGGAVVTRPHCRRRGHCQGKLGRHAALPTISPVS
jgi:hypothetical protein